MNFNYLLIAAVLDILVVSFLLVFCVIAILKNNKISENNKILSKKLDIYSKENTTLLSHYKKLTQEHNDLINYWKYGVFKSKNNKKVDVLKLKRVSDTREKN